MKPGSPGHCTGRRWEETVGLELGQDAQTGYKEKPYVRGQASSRAGCTVRLCRLCPYEVFKT